MPKGKPARRSRMISSRIISTASGAVVLIISSVMGAQVSSKVIRWGETTPEWNRVLHPGGARVGCRDAPSGYADDAQKVSKSQGVDKEFLAIL
jgi:hypothetical protein